MARQGNMFILEKFLSSNQIPKAQFAGVVPRDERMMGVTTKDNTPNFKPQVGKQLTPQQIEQRRVQALIDKQGTIRKYVPQSKASRVKEVALNPLTAFGYAARNESLPENFSSGERNVLDMATDVINPAFYINEANEAAQNVGSSVKNVAQGNLPAAYRDIKNAGMNTLMTLPMVAEFAPAVNQFVKSQRILPYMGEYKVPTIAESIGKYRPYVAEPEKGLAPYISQIGESGITREEEVFRNIMGKDYKKAKELENTIFLDAQGNKTFQPIRAESLKDIDYIKNYKKNSNVKSIQPVEGNPFIPRNSSLIDINGNAIDLKLFGFGKKPPVIIPSSSAPTLFQKEMSFAEQELARANADAAAFSNSPFNKQKLQEFRPNQEFNVSNQQARFIDDPVLNSEYQAFRNNGNLDYPETVAEQLGNSRGNYLANNHGDMNDVVMVDKFRPSTANVPTTSAYTDAMHEATHSRSIRLKATPQEEKIASAAWEPMIKNNDFGMPAEEAFAVQNELRASLGDIKGNRFYTEKDIPEIKTKLQELINTGHEYLNGTKVADFDMNALLKSLNKIGLGATVPAAVGTTMLQQQKHGGSSTMQYNNLSELDKLAIQELGGMLYANANNKLPHEQSMVKYLGPGKSVLDFMQKKVVGGPVPFDEYYRQNIINPRNKS